MLGIMDGRFENLADGELAVVAQHQHPAVEGAGDDGGEQAVAGDQR